MPNIQVLEEKQSTVAALTQTLKTAQSAVLCEYKGITVEADTNLRREMRKANVSYAVVKNTLLRRAANECGLEALDEFLHGSTALATSDSDLIAPAKVIMDYITKSKGTKFAVKAGVLEGKVIDKATVEKLAALPSREALLTMFLSVLTANLRGLAVAINAIAEQQGGGKAENAETAAEPTTENAEAAAESPEPEAEAAAESTEPATEA